RQKHPSLGPSHVWRADGAGTKDPIVKETSVVPHVIHGPCQNLARQCEIVRIEIAKREKGNNALGHTVNVYWIGAVVKVFRCAVLAKKVSSIELKTTPNAGFKLCCPDIPANCLQRAEVVSRVKVVNPLLRCCVAVVPGTIRALL